MLSTTALQKIQQKAIAEVSGIHFVGIGGVGMSGIAEVMATLGFSVSGSDIKASKNTQRLEAAGVTVHIGHAENNVEGASLIVTSSAVKADNPEVAAAAALGIPQLPRAQMLAELMRFRYGIAIAGTHGKTTTTSLAASVLAEAGLDPTYVIGGVLNSEGSNAALGKGPYLVAEADESDASFLCLNPMMAVVTNIEADHMSTYGGDIKRLHQSFIDFLHRLPFYGHAFLCLDDETIRSLLPQVNRPMTTYGFTADADVRAENWRQVGLASEFELVVGDQRRAVTLNLPGQHNVLNALAATAVALELGADVDAIAKALQQFEGIGRRFQIRGEAPLAEGSVTIVDDYAHHPSELKATLSAAIDAWPERRVVAVFQPHRYSRTEELFDDFVRELSVVDALVVTEVYPAGEAPISEADGRALCKAVRARGGVDPVFAAELDELPNIFTGMLRDGDVVVMMGAGSIGAAARDIIGNLKGLLND